MRLSLTCTCATARMLNPATCMCGPGPQAWTWPLNPALGNFNVTQVVQIIPAGVCLSLRQLPKQYTNGYTISTMGLASCARHALCARHWC